MEIFNSFFFFGINFKVVAFFEWRVLVIYLVSIGKVNDQKIWGQKGINYFFLLIENKFIFGFIDLKWYFEERLQLFLFIDIRSWYILNLS